MFEEIITALQEMNIGYEEMPEQGMLSIEVGEMDKMQLIEVLNMLNTMGMTVSQLDEATMMVAAGAEQPMETEIAPVEEENTEEDAAQMAALDEALSGM
jgi:predicted transcriptional regulator